MPQLRKGEITKEEMFKRLNALKQGGGEGGEQEVPQRPLAPDSPNPFDQLGPGAGERKPLSVPAETPDRKEVLQR